jgi:hypothetical protein
LFKEGIVIGYFLNIGKGRGKYHKQILALGFISDHHNDVLYVTKE